MKESKLTTNLIKKYIRGPVAVFIDAANILYSQKTLGWQIDYKKLAQYFKENFNLVFLGFYYGTVKDHAGQDRFFAMLKDRGFTLRTKPVKYINTAKGAVLKGNLDLELAFDMLTLKDKFGTCLLFSGDSDFEIVIKHLRRVGKRVIVFSTKGHISIELIRNSHKYIDLKKLKPILERKKIPPKTRGEVYSKNSLAKKKENVKRN